MPKQLIQLDLRERFRNALTDTDFKVYAAADGDEVELMIHGYVGDSWDEMDSLSVSRYLSDHRDKPVNVRINSPGGLAFDGIAIYNALASHPKPTRGVIEGMAGSAASIISQGVDHLAMAENGSFFIHRAIGVAIGNKLAMEDLAEFLDKIDYGIIATYAARTGLPKEEIEQLLNGKVDGTVFTADEAAAKGFVDEVIKARSSSGGEENDGRNSLLSEAGRARLKKQGTAMAVQSTLKMLDSHEGIA